jgi:putative copper resistance protein D
VIIGGGILWDGETKDVTAAGAVRRRAVVLGASAAAWALAYPQAAPAATVRACTRRLRGARHARAWRLVPMLDTGRYRDELTRARRRAARRAAGVWLFAELCRLVWAPPGRRRFPVTASA